MIKTLDQGIELLLKISIDYNAQMLALATVYAGQMRDMKPHDQKRLIKNIQKAADNYSKDQQKLLEELERLYDD